MKKSPSTFVSNLLAACAVISAASNPASVSASSGHSFDVKTYGAKGDGVTDDTKAIQAAIAAAEAAGNGAVTFPNGSYLFSQNLAVKGSIALIGQEGQAKPQAILLSENAGSSLVFSGTGGSVTGISFSSTVRANRAVNAQNANNCTISGCAFDPAFNTAIEVNGGGGIRISNNNITTSSGTGIAIASTAATVDSNQIFENSGTKSRGIRIVGCVNANVLKNTCSDTSIGADSIGILDQGSTSTQIVGNSVTGYNNCVYLNGDAKPTVSNNNLTVKGGSNGIESEAPNGATINENVIDSPTVTGIHILRNLGAVSITANTVSNTGSCGIEMERGGDISVDKNQLNQCGLSQLSRAVINIHAGTHANNISIEKNVYMGNKNQLQYFLWCLPKLQNTIVAGNRTNTTLPSFTP